MPGNPFELKRLVPRQIGLFFVRELAVLCKRETRLLDLQRQDVLRLKARINMQQVLEAAEEQPRSDQRNQGHRNFGNHQKVVRLVMPDRTGALASLLQGARKIGIQCPYRRQQTAAKAGHETNRQSESQHPAVQSRLAQDGEIGGNKGVQDFQSAGRKKQAQPAAQKGK